MDQSLIHSNKLPHIRIFALLTLITVAWFIAYNLIQPLADWISYTVLNLTRGSQSGRCCGLLLI